MEITTKFIDNTGLNLVNPFIPTSNYPFYDYVDLLMKTLSKYSLDIKKKISIDIDGNNAKIVVEMWN